MKDYITRKFLDAEIESQLNHELKNAVAQIEVVVETITTTANINLERITSIFDSDISERAQEYHKRYLVTVTMIIRKIINYYISY